MKDENNFNDIRKFNKELKDIIVELLTDKLKQMIEISLETHNCKCLKEIIKLINEYLN